MVGQSLGRKDGNMAQFYGFLAQRIAVAASIIMGLALFFMRNILILPFSNDAEIIFLGAKVIIVMAVMVPTQVLQLIFSTCLRVAGDTKYVAVVSFVCIALVQIAGSYIMCVILNWGLVGAWIGFGADQGARLLCHSIRFSRGKWTKIKL